MESFLSFILAKEKFAISITKVLEVLLEYKVVEVPDAPLFVEGVLNFRGDIVPIINFRKKFKFPEDKAKKSMLIILEITENDKTVVFGAVVDKVHNVFEIQSGDILPTPEFGSKYKPEYIGGMIKEKGDFLMIMNIEKVFSDKDVELLAEIAE